MRRSTRGFTLIELNLAIIFVAILAIGIAMVTINVTKINQRGVALKTINQTGREVMDIMRRDLSTAKPGEVTVIAPLGGVGRICLGTVSYVYNTAALLQSGGAPIETPDGESIALVRMDDNNRLWCQQSGGVFTKNAVDSADNATELLQQGKNTVPIAVHSMSLTVLAKSTDEKQGLFELQLQLGTNEADTIQTNACKPPTDHQANFDNCVVREFRTVVRANEIAQGGA